MARKKKKTISSRKKKKTISWKFDVILWNSKRTKQLIKKKVTVKRANRVVAQDFLRKKYPSPYIVELL